MTTFIKTLGLILVVAFLSLLTFYYRGQTAEARPKLVSYAVNLLAPCGGGSFPCWLTKKGAVITDPFVNTQVAEAR